MDSQPVSITPPPEIDYRPPAVREQAARADRMMLEHIALVNGQPIPPEVIPPVVPPSTEVKIPVVTQPTPPTPNDPPQQPEVIQRPAAMGPPLNDDDSIPPDGSTIEVWQQRCRSIKGRMDRERSESRNFIQQLTLRVQELESKLNAPQPAPNVTLDGNNIDLTQFGITQEEIDMAGPELVNIIKKASLGIASAQTGNLREQLVPDVEEAKRIAEIAKRQQFVDRNLDTYIVPKYGVQFAEINQNDNFKAFLKLTPPGHYVTLHELLKEAWARYDAPRVLQIVDSFLEGPSAPAGVVPPNPAPVTPAARVPQVSLASLAAPGSGHAPSTPAPGVEAKQTYTRAQVQEYYRAVQKGHLKDDPAAKAKYDAEIASAAAEGRII